MQCENNNKIVYPNVPSAIRPVPHKPELPSLVPPASLENMADDVECEHAAIPEDGSGNVCKPEDNLNPQRISQSEFNDQVCDLNLPKESETTWLLA